MTDRQQKGVGMILRTIIRFVSLELFLSLCLIISTAAAADSKQLQNRKHFLWSAEGRKATVYLLGSIHILKKDSYPLPAAIENIFSCCDTLVFETDLDGMEQPRVQNMMMKLGMYPAGRTLSKNISAVTAALLREKLRSSGIPFERFEQFKPWFVAINLTGIELERMGFDPSLGVDRYFYDRAKQEGKKMLFLETNEFQINLFGRLSRQKQELLLKQVVKELDIIETLFKEMITAWQSGDSVGFDEIMSQSFEEYPSIYKKFITRRNRSWIPEIIKLMNRPGDALVIVGAGHLVGRDSVIDILKKRGYTVRQL